MAWVSVCETSVSETVKIWSCANLMNNAHLSVLGSLALESCSRLFISLFSIVIMLSDISL